jgi:hypothetical protein
MTEALYTTAQFIYASISFKINCTLWIAHTSTKTRVKQGLQNIANSGCIRRNASKFEKRVQRTQKDTGEIIGMLQHCRCRCNRK